jgi:hypothetical protein
MRITDNKKHEIGEQLADVWREDGVYLHLGHAAVVTLVPVLLAPPKDDELAKIAGCDDLVARYIREAFKNRIAEIMRKPDPTKTALAMKLSSRPSVTIGGKCGVMVTDDDLEVIIETVRAADAKKERHELWRVGKEPRGGRISGSSHHNRTPVR